MLGWLLAVLAVLTVAFFAVSGDGTGFTSLDGGQIAYIVASATLVLLYLSTLASDYRGQVSKALGHGLVWIALGFGFVTLYAFRSEISAVAYRVAGEVVPAGRPMTMTNGENGERSVRLRRQDGGHFMARTEVNGSAMMLLVDTGASTVVLMTSDAERAGIETSRLQYSVPVQTANGTAYAAPIRLKTVAIGPIVLDDVEGLVAKPGSLNESLLGMSFLMRLRSYEFSGDFLTIRG